MHTPEPDGRRALRLLGYLYFRMGLYERAGRAYAALVALEPPDQPDTNARMALAAIAIRQGEGMQALAHLRPLDQGTCRPGGNTPSLFLMAQAYWLAGRRDEARNMIDEYLVRAGAGKVQ